jgi:hypothetical protein
MHITGKGLCVVISGINPNDLVSAEGKSAYNTGVFSDIKTIADCLRDGLKIAAIKEVRSQTGWGLKEAKYYIDKYSSEPGFGSMRYNPDTDVDITVNHRCAERFVRDHTPIPPADIFGDDDFKL